MLIFTLPQIKIKDDHKGLYKVKDGRYLSVIKLDKLQVQTYTFDVQVYFDFDVKNDVDLSVNFSVIAADDKSK